jgi:hypothetical protein
MTMIPPLPPECAAARRRWRAAPLLLSLALAACATKPPATIPPPEIEPPPPLVLPEPPLAHAEDDITPLLNYHQALRRMSQGELLKELSILGQPRGPKANLKTAMALMLTRGNGDLARAQALLDSVATSAEPGDAPYKPLAALLSAHCSDARRQAEHIDRLSLQLKDNQRRTDQLSEMLEALKTIERTLPARPATSAQAGAK